MGELGYTTIHILLVGAGYNQHLVFYVTVLEFPCAVGNLVVLKRRYQLVTKIGGNHLHPGTGTHQQGDLARSDLAATDHQAIAVLQLQKDREKIHGWRLRRAWH